jgi:DtxR family transcriptional regulator, Mn-dependent transcriptional regulator
LASLTIENYVKGIYLICAREDKNLATTGELAAALSVSPGTVTSMLKTLSDAELASYRPYEGVQLTEAGRLLALRVLRRHRLIELFLVRTLDLTWDEVHEEAENLEHAVSDFLIDRIDQYLDYPAADPHGDPIPRADGTVATPEGSLLSDWGVGDSFQLIRVLDQSPEFLRYLSDSGLELGVAGELRANHESAGVLAIRVGDQETWLACEAARKLLVARVAEDLSSDG